MMKRGSAGCTLLMVASVLGAASASAQPAPTIGTDRGPVLGMRHDGVDVFLGIPYAAPPTGERRLSPPVAPAAWMQPRRATVRPSACPQLASPDPAGLASNDEDCLYLNVWSPIGASSRPVIVWFHGGGFVEGYSAATQYDATRLAVRTGAVVVSVNYRVGALGFLAAAALDAADKRHVSGNYGLLDAQAALGWVGRNATAFGGDPHRVTVMGESAGANLILGLLASPASDGLFQRAIVQSATDGAHTVPLDQAETQTYAHALQEIGCTDPATTLQCLRAAPVQAFLEMTVKPTMVQDGTVLPLDPFAAFGQGRFTRVPVLIGSNAHENYLFTARTETDGLRRTVEATDLPGMMRASFGDKMQEVASEYPVGGFVNGATLIASALTDRRFSCMAELARDGMARQVKVYGYQLDIADPAQQQPLTSAQSLPNTSYHTTDLGYVFDTDDDGRALTGRHAALAHLIQDYWAAFVTSGDPNSASEAGPRPTWPTYEANGGAILSIADASMPKADFSAEHRCGFWQKTGLVGATWP